MAKMILKTGNMISCPGNTTATIEKIRIISKGLFIEQHSCDDKDDDVVQTVRDKAWIYNLWLKDTPIRLIEEREEKRLKPSPRKTK